MDRVANRSTRKIQVHQSNQDISQSTAQGSAKSSSQGYKVNQKQAPKMSQPVVRQNTMPSSVNLNTTSLKQESVDIDEFTGLKISGYSFTKSIAPPPKFPALTKELIAQICSAESKAELENYMSIAGISSLQELCEMRFYDHYSILTLLVKDGNAKLISLLLQSVEDPQKLVEHPQKLAEHQDNIGMTLLTIAANLGHAEVITAMLSGVPHPQQLAEKEGIYGITALMLAAGSGDVGVITKILESVDDTEALIFQKDHSGMNSFIYALQSGNTKAALVLFDWTKDKFELMFARNSPNQLSAIQMMKPEIQDIFLKKYNEPNH
jgi:hypothetical protein